MRRKFRASIRVVSDLLELEELTQLLGMEPDRGKSIGDPVSSNTLSQARRTSSIWSIRSSLEEEQHLEDHLSEVLDRLEHGSVRNLDDPRITFKDAFCFISSDISQCGFGLNQVILGRLSSLGLDLVLDVYASPEEP